MKGGREDRDALLRGKSASKTASLRHQLSCNAISAKTFSSVSPTLR